MKEKIQLLYQQMLTELDKCWQTELTDLEKIEKCFRLAIKGWYRLRDEFAGHVFQTREAEIDFFKNVKPLFTGCIEFYSIAYKAVLFKPEESKTRLKSFWKEELKRLHLFRKNNEEFINYYKGGDTSLDEQYFLRIEDASAAKPQEVGIEYRSSHDHLVSAIHAHELYHKYVLEQLKTLSEE